MGQCGGPGCERELFRGDIFFTPLDGKTYCVDCWEKVPGIDAEMHRVISTAIHDLLASGTSIVETYVEDGALHMQNVPVAEFDRSHIEQWAENHARDGHCLKPNPVPTSPPEPEEKREQVWDGEFPS